MGIGEPLVFLDACALSSPFVRMVFELFHDEAPFGAENFRVLCTGEKEFTVKTDKPLWLNGGSIKFKEGVSSVSKKKKKGVSSLEGDVLCILPEEGGVDAFGGNLPVESNDLKHDRAGLLSMPKGDGSQFLITLEADHSLDSSHVVIGKLVKGYGSLWWIRDKGPIFGTWIEDCGEYKSDDLPNGVIWKHYLSDLVDEGYVHITSRV